MSGGVSGGVGERRGELAFYSILLPALSVQGIIKTICYELVLEEEEVECSEKIDSEFSKRHYGLTPS